MKILKQFFHEQYDDQEEGSEEMVTSLSEQLTSLEGAAASTERPRHESSSSDGTATSDAFEQQSEVTAEDLVIIFFISF